jgi:hypothetical protein
LQRVEVSVILKASVKDRYAVADRLSSVIYPDSSASFILPDGNYEKH